MIIDYLIGKEDLVMEVNSDRKSDLPYTFVNEYELLENANRKIMEYVIQKSHLLNVSCPIFFNLQLKFLQFICLCFQRNREFIKILSIVGVSHQLQYNV